MGYIYKYYPDGTLSYAEDWKRNTTKSYYPSGKLQSKKTKRQYLTYFPTGRLKEKQYLWKNISMKIKRFESDDTFIRWTIPCYRWTQFDKNGSKILTIDYEGGEYGGFSVDLEQLFKKETLFTVNKVKLYQTNQKIVPVYDKESSTFVLVLYQKEGLCWIKQKILAKKDTLILLEQYQALYSQ